tara:strand:- start:287 stop:541 length:255 start_codon:yes stop_codon:yes gene_type:complete
MNNNYVELYAKKFKYKQLDYPIPASKEVFVKKVNRAFIVMESVRSSKYVDIYFNDKLKKFKKTDLLLSILENTPVGWEEENVDY